jgi:large subunit ribosomal protein L18
MSISKIESRKRRKTRIRQRVEGSGDRPRLTVFRSSRHIFAQVVNDEANLVLCALGTMGKTIRTELAGKKKIDQAKLIGGKIAQMCKEKGIAQVVFDRNGYRYHGRVLALATAARAGGLSF